MFRSLLVTVGVLMAASAMADPLPDPSLAPGALNPAVTQASMDRTICVRGWTKGVRPPLSYTSEIKRRLLAAAGLPWSARGRFELDHLIPLELGGAPRDPKNLWLEPRAGQWGAHAKDELENRLHELVCRHRMALPIAQDAIRRDWVAAYQEYMH